MARTPTPKPATPQHRPMQPVGPAEQAGFTPGRSTTRSGTTVTPYVPPPAKPRAGPVEKPGGFGGSRPAGAPGLVGGGGKTANPKAPVTPQAPAAAATPGYVGNPDVNVGGRPIVAHSSWTDDEGNVRDTYLNDSGEWGNPTANNQGWQRAVAAGNFGLSGGRAPGLGPIGSAPQPFGPPTAHQGSIQRGLDMLTQHMPEIAAGAAAVVDRARQGVQAVTQHIGGGGNTGPGATPGGPHEPPPQGSPTPAVQPSTPAATPVQPASNGSFGDAHSNIDGAGAGTSPGDFRPDLTTPTTPVSPVGATGYRPRR